MIPLIKIRATYLKRYKSKVIFSYGLIPIAVIIGIIIYLVKKDSDDKFEMNDKQIFEYKYGDEYSLFENSNFTSISYFLSNTSLVVNDENLGKKLIEYIEEEVGIKLKLYKNENELNNHSQNIILLDYNEKKDNYKFTYKEKDIKNANVGDIFPFNSTELSSLKAMDIFNYNYNNEYRLVDVYNKRFLTYQAFLAKFLIEKVKGKQINKDINFNFGLNSYPEAVKNPRDYATIEPMLSYLITMQFTFVFLSFSIQMLEEKEQKLEKLLERQGMSTFKYLCSWFINFIIASIFTNIATIFGGLQLIQSFWGIYILDIFLFNLSLFSLLLFIVTVSKNKKIGLLLVNLIGFGSLVFGYVLNQGDPHKTIQILFNFFPNANLFCSIKLIIKLQFLGKYSAGYLLLNYNGINYLDTLIMYIVEIIFYISISLFIRGYQNSGLNLIYYIKSIFTKVERKINDLSEKIEVFNQATYHEELNEKNQALKNQNLYLSIRNVTRKYDQLIAVNNFNGELFKNEIFCLLGHNGAGKTTLIKMISGAEDPDGGDIFLNNISVVTNKNYLFHNIGLCQQEDIFFDYLTVYEHLKYMMEIKGIKSDLQQISILINKIGLAEKQTALCKTLSGGEKRKLCVALALIGNSELVLLDEPTSGMDIISKRALWDFLKEFKNNKIIILTTHSLDEAEYLGDRIGIMTNGHYICSGTSSFLKSKYPCGFNLNLLIDSKICNDNIKQKLYNELIQYEPNLEIKISSKGLFSLNIQSNNQNIKEIFNVITTHKEEYGIEDYTVSSTSLEDVFLKLNHKITINEEEKTNEDNLIQINDMDRFRINIQKSFFSQLKSHIIRGYFSLWRNKGFSFLELLMGLFVLYVYIIIYYNLLGQKSQNVLSLTQLLDYNNVYICENNKDFLEASYVSDDLCSISLKTIDNKYKKEEFIENIYQNSLGNIGKSGICVTNLNSLDDDYEVINSEIPLSIPSYIIANSMLIVSSYLKKEYDINAAIFDEIINMQINEVGTIDSMQISIMFSICFACVVSLCIYLATIIAEKIRERVKNIKQILYLSGTNIWSYWGGFLIVDVSKMLIFISLASASIYLLNDYASYIWLNLLFTTFSSLFFIYTLSFIFEKEESGQKALSFLTFIIIIIFALVIIIMYALDTNIDLSFLLNKYNFTIFDISPITSFMLSSFRLTFSFYFFETMYVPDFEEFLNFEPFGNLYRPKNYAYTSLIVQMINLVFYFGILVLLESGYLKRFFNYLKVKYLIKETNITYSNTQISDEFIINNNYFEESNTPLLDERESNKNVINNSNNNTNNTNPNPTNNCIENEISKINNDVDNQLTTKIVALKKTYWLCCKKNIRAINNLYLGLENTEKFGLLGFNGSGKTTTFKAITKEILYDSGHISLFGNDINTQFNNIRQFIGYCPQENPLFDYMKVREIIKFYLSLKNINESVDNICNRFGLEKYLDTYCINLSGGNKRKLSFAIALMCRPQILLLDEPSTGVDPESRRIMWKNIMEISKKREKFNMILTTHSMEEAEVLCDKVSWLKSGNFLSIGNPEKLKIELSAGYKLHIKFMSLNENNNEIIENEKIDIANSEINGLNNFSELINNNKELQSQIKELENVISLIRDKCTDIELQKINKDLSFEFKIHVNKEKQSELFIQILDMKNTNKLLSEINISMESLENILTKL